MFLKFQVNRAPEGVVGGADGGSAASAPAATTDTATGTTADGVNGSTPAVDNGSWLAALDEDTRKTAEAKGWKSPADPIKSYNDLFKDYSRKTANSLTPPAEDAPPEAWSEFYNKLGRPEAPDGYEYKLPEGVPEDLPYDQNLAAQSKAWAHEAGLTPKQAQALHDRFAVFQAENFKAHQEAMAQDVERAHAALVKEWGDPASVEYKRNQELANRTLRNNGGEELVTDLKRTGVLDPNGNVRSPKLAAALAKIGNSLYAEDAVYAGPGNMPNPFAPGPTENLGEQGKLIRSNPQLAKALMRQANVDPALYGMKD